MSILKVARMGHPVLRVLAEKLSPKDIKLPEVQLLIDNMIETMREYDGVGLAAPQVHESLQIAVLEIGEENPRYPEKSKIEAVEESEARHGAGSSAGDNLSKVTVLINPVITTLTDETLEFWEGCLSVPGMRGLVKRPRKIRLEALDRDGKKTSREVDGFPAIAVQHELDHLFGTLYVDKLVSTHKFSFSEEYQKYHLGENEDDQEV